MAGMMDWDAYRQEAGRQTAALNQAPYVVDPAKLTSDATANNQMFYGNDGTPNSISKIIEKAFTDYYGRPAEAVDIQAWTQALADQGATPEMIRQQIEASAKDPRNAATVKLPGATFGTGVMGAATPSAAPFQMGLMGGVSQPIYR